MGKEDETDTEVHRRALRRSRFAPLPSLPAPSRSQPRLAHPAGPMTTNKAAALAKFLERKLQEPGGLTSINPDLLERAVNNAKDTIKASKGGISTSGRIVRHVASFGDDYEDLEKDERESPDRSEETKQKKKNMRKNERKKSGLETGKSLKHKKKVKS